MDPAAHAVALACKGFLDDEEGLRLHDLARDQNDFLVILRDAVSDVLQHDRLAGA